MRSAVMDDRVLARLAYHAAGHGAEAAAGAAEIAFGRAVVALRVEGAHVGAEALKVLRADIDEIFARPAELARARSFASSRRTSQDAASAPRSASARVSLTA